jgi:hypothetical protein
MNPTFKTYKEALREFNDLLSANEQLKAGDKPSNFDRVPGIQYSFDVTHDNYIDTYYQVDNFTRLLTEEELKQLVQFIAGVTETDAALFEAMQTKQGW